MKNLILPFLFVSSFSYAESNIPSGHEVTNGGNFLVCANNSQVVSLDRIEGATQHGLQPSARFSQMSDEFAMVRSVLADLQKVNPARATRYQQWLGDIESSRIFVEDAFLSPVRDSGYALIPEGCQLRQAAFFTYNPMDMTSRFYYSKALWDQASPLDRAYLLLHEIVYREAKLPENSHANSMASRYITAYLMANADHLDPAQLVTKLSLTQFKYAEYNKAPLVLFTMTMIALPRRAPLEYHENGAIKKAVLHSTFKIAIDGTTYARQCPEKFNGEFQNFVEFYASGKIKSLSYVADPETAGCEAGFKEFAE